MSRMWILLPALAGSLLAGGQNGFVVHYDSVQSGLPGQPTSVAELNDGGFLLSGIQFSPGTTGQLHVLLRRTDQWGHVLSEREVPMDPWHLSQVLIGNSELTNEVWRALEESEVLSPFFLALIDQYQGQQSPRAIYEQEIALRQGQKSRLQHRLLRHYAQDTVSSGDPADSMDDLLAMDPSPTALLARYWLACSRNDAATAATVEASLHEVEGADDVIDLGAMLLHAQGSWSDLQGDDLQALELYAVQEGRQGSAVAWAARIGLAEFDSLPPALIPAELRTLWQPRKRQWEGTYDPLQAYPNPANERVLITFLHGLMAGQLVCYDAQGKLIHAVRFGEGAPFVEIDTRQWAPGLYLATAQRDGYRLGEVKFTISR